VNYRFCTAITQHTCRVVSSRLEAAKCFLLEKNLYILHDERPITETFVARTILKPRSRNHVLAELFIWNMPATVCPLAVSETTATLWHVSCQTFYCNLLLSRYRPCSHKSKFHLAGQVTSRLDMHDTTRSTCRAHAFWPCRRARLDALDMSNVSCRDVTWRAKWNLGYMLCKVACTHHARLVVFVAFAVTVLCICVCIQSCCLRHLLANVVHAAVFRQ